LLLITCLPEELTATRERWFKNTGMKSKPFFSCILDYLFSVEQHLVCFAKDRDLERLHLLRVDLKKVKAIVAFINKVYHERISTDSLNILFKKAGEIRELQINCELLSQLPHPPQNIIGALLKEQDILLKQFIKDLPLYFHLLQNFPELRFLDFVMPGKRTIRKYLRRLTKKAATLFNSHDRNQMHLLRKVLKKILYVYAILPKKILKYVGIKTALLHEFQKDLGNWHDNFSAITFLSGKDFEAKTGYVWGLIKKEQRQFETLVMKYPRLKI
jgi:CHAD domain-containing protein